MTASISKKNAKIGYKKHYPYEVVSNVNDSKLLADSLSQTHKYQYLMEIHTVGDASIRPYDPVYFDGLPNGLSGYWTVLSVKHRFGGSHGYYMLEMIVGTNTLGEVNSEAAKAVAVRDIEGELGNQSLTVADSILQQIPLSPNETDFPEPRPLPGPAVSASDLDFPNNTDDPYAISPPSFSNVKNSVSWVASLESKII